LSLYPNSPLEMPAPPPAPPQPEIPVENPVWRARDVVLLSIAAIVAIYICLTAAVTVLIAVYSTEHPGEAISRSTVEQLTFNPYVLVIGQGLGYVALVAVMLWLVRGRYKSPFWPSLKWNWPGRRWFAYLVGGVALAILVQFALQFLPIPKSLPIQRYFETAQGAYLMAFFGILIAPPVEELYFRGFLYPVLARGFARAAWRVDSSYEPPTAALIGTTFGVIFTAAGFALIHGAQLAHSWAPLAVLFTVGLVITGVRAYSKSLSAGLLIHMGYNATLFVLLYLGTDGFRHLDRMP
jgi:uncharacterized protein